MSNDVLRIGVVGCGGFAIFVLPHFKKIPGIEISAMADNVLEAAKFAGEKFGVPYCTDAEELANRDDVDIVYIATPPSLHHTQAMAALKAGKHVVCEKPLAVSLEEADEMVAMAKEKDLLLVANLMQRYNPLADKVRELIESKALGEVLHGFFENYAGDEQLTPDHWFWDYGFCGGIFVEHAVHFFDLFESWLGQGKVEAAQRSLRTGTEIEDQVHCTVRYGDCVLVNFYHGFTQTGRMDRQEMRLLFERGDIALHEWIPTRADIRAVVNETTAAKLNEIFEDSEVRIIEEYSPEQQHCKGRHKEFDVSKKIEMTYGASHDKMNRYAELVHAMMVDQVAWIRDRNHVRRLTEKNGRDSLALAVASTEMAHKR